MSDADPEAVTVSADGISVHKAVETERFQTPAVVIELTSEREDAIRVQLVDQIPSAVSMDDVGFHPDYGSQYWSLVDNAIAFERDLKPGESYTTIYGIRGYPSDEIDALLDTPQIELAETGPESLDEVVDEDRSQMMREFVAGEADLPGLEREEAVGGDAAEAASAAAEAADSVADAVNAATDTAEAAGGAPAESEPAPGPQSVEPEGQAETEAEPEPAAEPAAEREPAAESGTGTEPPAEPEPEMEPDAGAAAEPAPAGEAGEEREVRVPLTGGVVRVLIKELREGDIDPEDRRMLRDELIETEGSHEARLAHLQQRVSDLEAYGDALEEFIDEEGTAEAIITDLRENVASLERTVEGVDDRMDEVVEGMEVVEDEMDSVADDVATVESREGVLADRVEDLEDEIAGVDQRVDDLGARIDRVSTDIDDVDNRLSDVNGHIEDLRDELQILRRDLGDRIKVLEDDLDDFQSFRNRLSTALGGGPGGSFDDEADGE